MADDPGLPIFEDDLDEPGVIGAHLLHRPRDLAPVAVLCFFNDLLVDLAQRGVLVSRYVLRSEIGSNHIYEVEVDGRTVSVMHPGVGSPLAVGFVEEAAAVGLRTFVACGGAGALNPSLDVGHVMVVDSAVRDEGTSAHYVRPSRVISAQDTGVSVATRVLSDLDVPHFVGRTWTTDAMFRETPSRIKRRVEEGCHMVDMEASALMAIARFRGLTLAHLLYAGDMVAGGDWDSRHWDRATSVRESLFWASTKIALALHDDVTT
jgi:uridine phosphorylase